MTDSEPDYSNCTLDELYGVRRVIDFAQDSAGGSHVREEWCNEMRTRPSSLW